MYKQELKLFKADEDYAELVTWWGFHNHPPLPVEMLSPFGVTALVNDQKACMSFIYFVQGCDMAQIAWTTTNSTVAMRERYVATDLCIKGLIDLAKKNNITNLMCFSDSSGLNKLFNKNGLKELRNHRLLYSSLGVF
jgi:hypothetical protein